MPFKSSFQEWLSSAKYIFVRKTFVEVATQHFCGVAIDLVSEGAFCQV